MVRRHARSRAGIAVAFGVAIVGACGRGSPDPRPAIVVRDDAGVAVALAAPARRIVSLVPSVTDAIVALGSVDRLVGRTRYDAAPEVAHLSSVGGGLDPSVEAIVSLRPDLVVGWSSASQRGLRDRLGAAGIPMYAARIEDTTAVYRTFDQLGTILGRRGAADRLSAALRDSLAAIVAEGDAPSRPAVLFVLPGDPPRTAGPNTFVAQLIGVAGGRLALPDLEGDWPIVSLEAVLAARPDVVVLPIEGGDDAALATLAGRRGWRELEAVRAGRAVAVPPDLFVRPGPQLGYAARTLQAGLARVAPKGRSGGP